MHPRRTAPAHVVEYFLDGAQECYELDGCSAMALRLYGDDATLVPLLDGTTANYRERQGTCIQLAAIADGILPRLSPERRGGLIFMGACSITYDIEQLACTLSQWGIDDEVDGGDLKPFRTRLRSRKGIVFRRTMRRLRSPSFIRRSVRENAKETAHLAVLAGIVTNRIRSVPLETVRPDRGIRADWMLQINAGQRLKEIASRRSVKATRKMVARSAATAVSILGAETVGSFLRGETITIMGENSALSIAKRGSLSQKGHGCLSVGLADRTGVRLADLCTYVEGTPTLDQLSAFALWMQAGEERQVLEVANIVDLTPAGRDHPLIKQRSPRRNADNAIDLIAELQELAPDRIDGILDLLGARPRQRIALRQLSYEQLRTRNDVYWEETKPHWIEALTTRVLGRSAAMIKMVERHGQ